MAPVWNKIPTSVCITDLRPYLVEWGAVTSDLCVESLSDETPPLDFSLALFNLAHDSLNILWENTNSIIGFILYFCILADTRPISEIKMKY